MMGVSEVRVLINSEVESRMGDRVKISGFVKAQTELSMDEILLGRGIGFRWWRSSERAATLQVEGALRGANEVLRA